MKVKRKNPGIELDPNSLWLIQIQRKLAGIIERNENRIDLNMYKMRQIRFRKKIT